MKRQIPSIVRASAALLILVASAATASAADFLVTGTGKVGTDDTWIAPHTLAFTVELKGTLAVDEEMYRFNKAISEVVQIFPPGEHSSIFWSDVTLDLGQGDVLYVSTVQQYIAELGCFEGIFQITGGTGVFEGAHGSGTTITCPPVGFMWEGVIK
ncbi:MAG: SH3 domain-containing protein [Planctomycetota bacterium]|jgi:hypothetical protein